MSAFPRPFNTSSEPTIAEELAHLHAQLGSHIRRQGDQAGSSAVFLVRMSVQLDTLKARAFEEEASEEAARAKIGAVRRVMGIEEQRTGRRAVA